MVKEMTAQTTIALYPNSQGADISHCGRYRYRLWREWNHTYPACCFIMLNPSTADANIDDPTIRKCIGFAKKWGYGRLNVVNLFAWRATDPGELKKQTDPVGKDNFEAIVDAVKASERVILAWGRHGSLLGMGGIIKMRIAQFYPDKAYVLKINKDGSPKHPLYAPYSTEPFKL